GRRIAIPAGGHPFAGPQHVTGANRLLGVGGVDRARFVEAPGPWRPARAFQTLLALLELGDRKLGIDRAHAVRVSTRLDGVAIDSCQVCAVLNIAGANRDLRVARLRYAWRRGAQCELLPT